MRARKIIPPKTEPAMTPVIELWAGGAATKAAVLVSLGEARVEIAGAGVTELE